MFIISVKIEFSAAHRIKGYKGNCSQFHGHNYKVEVNVKADEVNKIGMCVDFRKLSKISKNVVSYLDHKNLNDVPLFKKNNPTAESIAKFIYEKIKQQLKGALSLYSVKVWETDKYAVTYSENKVNSKEKIS
ncbi:6-carboxytetrahydropterin synthase QueD [candidate division WOR-3 bacterium]|nr:6-carboxytetrahydropterin synthase QueD [candidate division WOR-3 bacterium]